MNRRWCFVAVFLLSATFFFSAWAANAETVSGLDIVPDLDVTKFSPYKLRADVSGSPTSVSLSVSGINGDGGSYWNYYADGTPASQTVTKTMSFLASSSQWQSANFYPDDIYPEIFFAPSSITFNDDPSNRVVRTGEYQIMHFYNPFSMVASSTFFIEVNASPRSLTQSVDLEIYVVEKNKTADFFTNNWLSSADAELVGTVNRNTAFHHDHVVGRSSHHLIPLTINSNGTVGSKNLDISGDFWVVVYADSPSSIRGWNFKYQPSSRCTADNLWYRGNVSTWSVTPQAGCPDSHIHLARRGDDPDGVMALVTANYAGGVIATSSANFYFSPLPNLAPNLTSFINPVAGGVYNGNGVDEVLISWNPATDPNEDDSLIYSLYLLDSAGATSSELVTGATSTSYLWDISSVPNGEYGLRGIVCDNAVQSLCTPFVLSSNFFISKSAPVYSLSSISIDSNNSSTTRAKAGDTVTLHFTSTGALSATTSVTFYSGGEPVSDSPEISNVGNSWTASYVVGVSDVAGDISFSISANNLNQAYILTTDQSSVEVIRYILSYSAAAGGSLTGSTTQSVAYGQDGTSVTALPSGNYYFYSWSDGSTANPRTDLDISADVSVTANFYANSGAAFVPPGAKGEGAVDLSVKMGASASLGVLPKSGANILAYIGSKASFVSGMLTGSITISELDLFRNVVTVKVEPSSQSIILGLGDVAGVDVNGDGKIDVSVKFLDVYINRVELTVNPESGISAPSTSQSPIPEKSINEPRLEPEKPQAGIIFERNLWYGVVSDDVKSLQSFLNAVGFMVSKIGPGSAGNETSFFGPATRSALAKFQSVNKISPAVGFFGPITRAFINGW
jgi:hypothetical protein